MEIILKFHLLVRNYKDKIRFGLMKEELEKARSQSCIRNTTNE